MKAVFHVAYGPPELLRIEETDKPVPGDRQVLLKVHATTVSSGDCNSRNLTFVPASMKPIAKAMFGFSKPRKRTILGTQAAGEVEAVGKDIRKFKVGDRVFVSCSMQGGGHAQYLCVNEEGAIAMIPEGMSWEEAVAVPFGADTALYYLRDLGKMKAGQELLIIGASGSIGTAAVQLAKHSGLRVTGICSGRNVELVKSLGADEVLDYTREEFSKNGKRYDLILDTAAATTFAKAKGSLKPKGVFLPCIMTAGDMLFRIAWTALTGGKRLKGGVAIENAERMGIIRELMATGKLKPVIDRTYPLEQIAEAFRYVETGRKRGSVVITVPHP